MKPPKVFRANVAIEIRDAVSGALLQRQEAHNLVVDLGLNKTADLLGGSRNIEPTHISLGLGTNAPASTDTGLVTEAFRNVITKRVKGNKTIAFQLFVSQAQGNGFTYQEAGLLNRVNQTDTLYARVVFSPIIKTASVTITFTWNVALSAA